MTPPRRVRWAEESADLIGSPQDLQKRMAAHQVEALGQSGTQPERASSSDAQPTIPAKTCSPRSPRSLWVDKWQR